MLPPRLARPLGALFGLALPTLAAAQVANEDQQLVPGDVATGQLATAVAVSGDRAVLGARGHDHGGVWRTGAAWVFERSADGFVEVAELLHPLAAAGDEHGTGVAVRDDRILTGAPQFDGALQTEGRAYVWERAGDGTWNLAATLHSNTPSATERFGQSVALGDDLALVGAPGNDDGAIDTGAVYVFERQSDGAWVQAALLRPAIPERKTWFGERIALDGDTLAVGVPNQSFGTQINCGAVFLFERQPDGSWVEVQKLVQAVPTTATSFGISLDVSGDALIVAPLLGIPPFGGAHVYRRTLVPAPQGGAAVEWKFEESLASPTVLGPPAYPIVALEGDRAIISGTLGTTGGAWLFERAPGGGWAPIVEFRSSDGVPDAYFGAAVALDGDLAGFAQGGSPGGAASAIHFAQLGALYHGAPALSVAAGGEQSLVLAAGPEHAGGVFVLLGSASGTAPATPLGAAGLELPLVVDAYTLALLSGAAPLSLAPIAGPLGALLHHAFVVLDPAQGFATSFASNAVTVELVP